MFSIVEGSLEKLKNEINQMKKLKADEIKALKKRKKQWFAAEKKAARVEKRSEKMLPREFGEELHELEGLQEIYSSVIPVRVGDILIDYKSLKQAIDMLKDFEITVIVDERKLTIAYKQFKVSGAVQLYDVSNFFKEFQSIPIVEIHNVQKA